ncbi:MAG: PIN domain-containing protein [Myxococcales bacterium]|nr:PIN domain-containing protein [Myxococcales bacterium]
MKIADTSVVVAGFASWHEKHEAARRLLDEGLWLVDHSALETYSVLTRLPPPHRAAGSVVRDFLAARFRRPFLRMSPTRHRRFLLGLAGRGIAGGAVYDALIAATAAEAGAELATCDRRAQVTYGVRILAL